MSQHYCHLLQRSPLAILSKDSFQIPVTSTIPDLIFVMGFKDLYVLVNTLTHLYVVASPPLEPQL